jgi:hypothetical protein
MLEQTPTWPVLSQWHPEADIEWLLGATELGAMSALILLPSYLHCLKRKRYKEFFAGILSAGGADDDCRINATGHGGIQRLCTDVNC